MITRLFVRGQWLNVAQLAALADVSITEMRRRLKRFECAPRTDEATSLLRLAIEDLYPGLDISRPAPSNISSRNKIGDYR